MEKINVVPISSSSIKQAGVDDKPEESTTRQISHINIVIMLVNVAFYCSSLLGFTPVYFFSKVQKAGARKNLVQLVTPPLFVLHGITLCTTRV